MKKRKEKKKRKKLVITGCKSCAPQAREPKRTTKLRTRAHALARTREHTNIERRNEGTKEHTNQTNHTNHTNHTQTHTDTHKQTQRHGHSHGFEVYFLQKELVDKVEKMRAEDSGGDLTCASEAHPRTRCGAGCRYPFATDHGGNVESVFFHVRVRIVR